MDTMTDSKKTELEIMTDHVRGTYSRVTAPRARYQDPEWQDIQKQRVIFDQWLAEYVEDQITQRDAARVERLRVIEVKKATIRAQMLYNQRQAEAHATQPLGPTF